VSDDERDLSRVPPQLRAHCFKAGQSGNPEGGRRRGFDYVLREVLDEKVADPRRPGSEVSRYELLIRVFLDECLKRNSALIREFLAREWPVRHLLDVGADVEVRREGAREELARRLSRIAAEPPGDAPRGPRPRGGNGTAA
jgi:hypothetical protein